MATPGRIGARAPLGHIPGPPAKTLRTADPGLQQSMPAGNPEPGDFVAAGNMNPERVTKTQEVNHVFGKPRVRRRRPAGAIAKVPGTVTPGDPASGPGSLGCMLAPRPPAEKTALESAPCHVSRACDVHRTFDCLIAKLRRPVPASSVQFGKVPDTSRVAGKGRGAKLGRRGRHRPGVYDIGIMIGNPSTDP